MNQFNKGKLRALIILMHSDLFSECIPDCERIVGKIGAPDCAEKGIGFSHRCAPCKAAMLLDQFCGELELIEHLASEKSKRK